MAGSIFLPIRAVIPDQFLTTVNLYNAMHAEPPITLPARPSAGVPVTRRLLCGLLVTTALVISVRAATLPSFDFTNAAVCSEWQATHHIAALRSVPEGLEITIGGSDPFTHGPPRDYPPGVPLRLVMRLKSDSGGLGQIFYFRDHASEEQSATFISKGGEWMDIQIMLPSLGPGYRLRFDPPGSAGRTVVAFLRFEAAAPLESPAWPPPEPLDLTGALRLESGPLALQVAERGFRVTVQDRPVASSHTRPLLGYVVQDQLRWLDLGRRARTLKRRGGVETRLQVRDADGATWMVSQRFTAGTHAGVMDLTVTVETDRDRDVAFLPLLLLAAREDSTDKGQAVFPGLEYLENEPSSSEADVIGPQSRRQVPANHKLTFPLMAIQADGHYVGLVWEHEPRFSALFDSPDRVLNTGGHVMGVFHPGSDGFNRHEGDLMPTRTEPLRAGRKLVLKAQIIGGQGNSVVPAIQQYVKVRGLPPAPPSGYSFHEYVTFTAGGWLDSDIREGYRFRHAIFGDRFRAQPAADAAMYLQWLAGHAKPPALRQRLAEVSRQALAEVPPGHLERGLIGHVEYPVQSLVFGGVEDSVEYYRGRAQGLLRRIRPDGTVAYRPGHDGVDYGRTHYADHANGISARELRSALDAAMFAGDPVLTREALARLCELHRTYANGVPRGAQTWEVPLHTPDILASAHLIRAFTMGYQLTGEREYLEAANYWAWTGLPFLYLVNPVGTSDVPYGCITVFGATAWKFPVWLGRPVQWCGLVYADALYRLLPYDSTGPWKQVADGITATGLRYCWPAEDRANQGLLPDAWEVLGLIRVDPPINPGTVQANAVNFYGKGSLYECRVLQAGRDRIIVHAPGEIVPAGSTSDRARFKVRAWPGEPYFVLLNGFSAAPRVKINGRLASLAEPHAFEQKTGRLILRLSGQPTLEVEGGP
jgi:hypothetical protein